MLATIARVAKEAARTHVLEQVHSTYMITTSPISLMMTPEC